MYVTAQLYSFSGYNMQTIWGDVTGEFLAKFEYQRQKSAE